MRVSGRARASVVAFVTLCAVVYTSAECPRCRRRIMDVPGTPTLEARIVETVPSGRGRTLACQRCKTVVEVIEHYG